MVESKSSRGERRSASGALTSRFYKVIPKASDDRSRRRDLARIIIADDDPIIIEVVRQILEPHGHIVGALEDGMRVREVAEMKHPDLLILDCSMPGKSGLAALREVRDSPQCRQIPVLMLTARRSRSDEDIGYRTGADDYLVKPFDPDKLVFRVGRLLEKGSRFASFPTSLYG